MRMRITLCLILPLLMAGCAQLPLGPPRLGITDGLPADQLARLGLDGARKVTTGQGTFEWVELRAFDRVFVNEQNHLRREYLMAPGTHRLTLRYMYDNDDGHAPFQASVGQVIRESTTRVFEHTISMNAKPGGTYTVKFAVDGQTGVSAEASTFNRTTTTYRARYWVEDSKTGETVSH
jgi:hypothetical protein